MNKILWSTVAFCGLTAIYWLMTGIGPRAVPVIKPSNFDDISIVAEYTQRQLTQKIKQHRYFSIGIEDNRTEHVQIAQNLIPKIVQTLQGSTLLISTLPIEKKDYENVENIYLDEIPEGQRRAKINELIISGKNIIFLFTSFDAIHFRPESMMNTIEKAFQIKGLSFAVAGIAKEVDEKYLGDFCVEIEKDGMNYRPLACLIMSKSVHFRKNKKISFLKPVFWVEQQGERDYMIYTWVPQS